MNSFGKRDLQHLAAIIGCWFKRQAISLPALGTKSIPLRSPHGMLVLWAMILHVVCHSHGSFCAELAWNKLSKSGIENVARLQMGCPLKPDADMIFYGEINARLSEPGNEYM